MAMLLSTVLIVLVLAATTFGYHSRWIEPSYQYCDPCQSNTCADPLLPHCRAVGIAGAAVTVSCFSSANLNQSPVSRYRICAVGAGNPVAMASGQALTCTANSDCPTGYVCYRGRSWPNNMNVCCKDPSTCDKIGNCPSIPHCHWYSTCTSDSNCYGQKKCCGPYTGISSCLAATKYCQHVYFSYSGK